MQSLRSLARPLARIASRLPPAGIPGIARFSCKKLSESSYHHAFYGNSIGQQSVLSSWRLFPATRASGIFAATFGTLGGFCFNGLHASPEAVASTHHDKQEKFFLFSPNEDATIGNGDDSSFLSWLRRLWVPFFLIVTVISGWEHPISLVVNIFILLLSTKPPPSSFYMWEKKRRLQQACQKQGLDRIKAKLSPNSLMHVEIHDYLLFCVANAHNFSERLTAIGILNEWWTLYSSCSSFTGFGLSSLRKFLSESNQNEA